MHSVEIEVPSFLRMRLSKSNPDAHTATPSPGGADRDRTDDLLLAKQALYQLSYSPGSLPRDRRPTHPSGRLPGVRGVFGGPR